MTKLFTKYESYLFDNGGNCFIITVYNKDGVSFSCKVELHNLKLDDLFRRFGSLSKSLGSPDCRIILNVGMVLTWVRHLSNRSGSND